MAIASSAVLAAAITKHSLGCTSPIDGPWKLIEFSNGTRALYNVVTDPQETIDLAFHDVERADALARQAPAFQTQ